MLLRKLKLNNMNFKSQTTMLFVCFLNIWMQFYGSSIPCVSDNMINECFTGNVSLSNFHLQLLQEHILYYYATENCAKQWQLAWPICRCTMQKTQEVTLTHNCLLWWRINIYHLSLLPQCRVRAFVYSNVPIWHEYLHEST